MKRCQFYLLFILPVLLMNCSNPLEKQLNKDDLKDVLEIVNNDASLKKMKKKFINDNLSMFIGFAEMGKAFGGNEANIKTFGAYIEELKLKYDSTENSIKANIENNKKIKSFIELTDAGVVPVNEYEGYINLKMKFHNDFKKPVLYIVFGYKYVDKYDSEYFNERAKLTDKLGKDFKGEIEISNAEKYNDVAKFIYNKVPRNKKKQKEYLFEGLTLETQLIVFNDKTELAIGDEEWEYLEK